MTRSIVRLAAALLLAAPVARAQRADAFRLNAKDYFTRAGVDVMAFADFYPDGHQGGVSVIQHGVRVASNGDLRLEPTPGQWSPMPMQVRREVHREAGEVVTWLAFPDTSKDRHGFNPIVYPDLRLTYRVRVRADGDAVRVTVDLDRPLPAEWVGRVGFNLELYPGDLFGRTWQLGTTSGIFPRQPDGPMRRDAQGELQPTPFAEGPRLTIAGETEDHRLTIESRTGALQLLDGRNKHNNGWFIVRGAVPANATAGAVEWVVRPHAIPGWKSPAVVQVSQLGYHPAQRKLAVIELDPADTALGTARVSRVSERGGLEPVLTARPTRWQGSFLRYGYAHVDFTSVTRPGMYVIEYRGARTTPFRIASDVYGRGAWQPTLDYFLPVQMCHVRVEEQYRVWHGVDHLDDARMAPTDSNHFDGYVQGPSTLTRFRPGDVVPGLDVGGWHDAGDYDMRIESQADEVWTLASTYELFGVDYDNTTVDQAHRLVRIHQPDGKPDLLQQTEHGVLTMLAGYRALGRLYRGIIEPTLKQYVLLGDPATNSDNRFAARAEGADDRLVFTEQNPSHEYKGIAALAIAGRVLATYDGALARESVAAAEALWRQPRDSTRGLDERVSAAVELLLTTRKPEYRDALLAMKPRIVARAGSVAWLVGRALPLVNDAAFTRDVRDAVARDFATVQAAQRRNPYGVPYEPVIWGAGWGIQEFGVRQYFLHRAFPDVVSADYMLNALDFVLGRHPGRNTASFASGVGARSMTTAYGVNRADWSYIPGGVVSGTALIRPDFPELKDFPFLWQQAEYVLGGGASNYMFLAIAADRVLNERSGRDAGARDTTALRAYPASGDRVRVMGRHELRGDTVSFGAAGVTFYAKFRGATLGVDLVDEARDGGHDWFTVVVDGGEPTRFRTEAGVTRYTLASGLAPGVHALALSKATEGQNGHDQLATVHAAELLPPDPLPTRRIEYIGDSITDGYGMDPRPIACGQGAWYDPTHAWLAYGPRVARSVNAQWMLSAISGIGMVRNWNSPAPVMPRVYGGVYMEYADSLTSWDVRRYTPDLVVIALGTNDFSDGGGPTPRAALDGDAFVADYVHFVADVRARYPRAQLLLVDSPMLDSARDAQLNAYLARVIAVRAAAGDHAIAQFSYGARYVSGCQGHPDLQEHARMADALAAKVRSLMGW